MEPNEKQNHQGTTKTLNSGITRILLQLSNALRSSLPKKNTMVTLFQPTTAVAVMFIHHQKRVQEEKR
jgi:hypothetical protein